MNYSIKNRWVLLGLALMVIPSVAMMSGFWSELTEVQKCTAEGMGFDYRTGECIEGSTIFVPFSERQPLLVNSGMLLSTLGLIFCLIGLYKKR